MKADSSLPASPAPAAAVPILRGTTKLVGVIGWPVTHSLSPVMHNAAFASAGMDWAYVPLSVAPDRVGEAVRGLRALGFVGANVTIPHKQAVIPNLDQLDPDAERIGAVNTIHVQPDSARLKGYNTDYFGAYDALEAVCGISAAAARVVILGAGGTARALAFGAVARGATALAIINRDSSAERARALAGDVATQFPHLEIWGGGASDGVAAAELEQSTIVFHTTPLGMKSDDPLPIEPARLPRGGVVMDAVYRPGAPYTPFLEACREQRASIILGGRDMLLYQGVRSFRIWTGVDPDITAMRVALDHATAKR